MSDDDRAKNWSKPCPHGVLMHLEPAIGTWFVAGWYQPVAPECNLCKNKLREGILPLAFRFGDAPERKPAPPPALEPSSFELPVSSPAT